MAIALLSLQKLTRIMEPGVAVRCVPRDEQPLKTKMCTRLFFIRMNFSCVQERVGVLAHIHNQKVQDILAFYLSQLETNNELAHGDLMTQNFWIGRFQSWGMRHHSVLKHCTVRVKQHLCSTGLTFKPLKELFRWDSGKILQFSSFAFGQPDNQGYEFITAV